MEIMSLTSEQFETFRTLQIKPRADWPATFSCNAWEEVWPFSGYGLTYEGDRQYIRQKEIPILDEIVNKVLAKRPAGGRFFVDDRGVFLSDEGQIIYFVIS
jgi:hypothetical protein